MVYEEMTGPLDASYRVDVAAGVVAATVANANRAKKGKRFKAEDFMPKWGGKQPQTMEQQIAAVEQINRALGGKDLRPQGR